MHKTPGCYVARVQVPASFLMPGIYTLSAHAFQMGDRDFNPLHLADDVIRFTVCETGTDVAKYNDHKNVGVVLVNFPWTDEIFQDRDLDPRG